MSFTIRKPLGRSTIAALVTLAMLLAAHSASANIVRPNAATPLLAPLALAYTPCTSGGTPPGEVHNFYNIYGPACTPPSLITPRLTAGGLNGTSANFKGFVKLVVQPGNIVFP